MNDEVALWQTDLPPQRFSRAFHAVRQTQRDVGRCQTGRPQGSNQVHVVIYRVLLSHGRLHQASVNPGADGTFSDETESDPLCRFRKERHERRTIIAGEIEAKIESSPDQIQPKPERSFPLVNPDFVNVRNRRRELGGMWSINRVI